MQVGLIWEVPKFSFTDRGAGVKEKLYFVNNVIYQ